MSKYNYTTRITYYQKARFFRKTGTDEFAYCIEPFQFFEENESYQSTSNPNLTQEKLDRISKIAYYGYGYKNHTDKKWYAITQFMIWQASDSAGNYYFTDTLNGSPINRFLEEINEINNLVNTATITPSFNNQTIHIIEDETLRLEDKNQVLNQYITLNENQIIEDNSIIIENLKEGTYTFQLLKEFDNYHKPLIFYQSNNSQNLVKTGDINNITSSFQVEVIKTNIQVTKIDKDTKSTIPSGEGTLDGAIYELYDDNNNKISELEIIENQAIVENLPFGKYYLKEIKPGNGYLLDNSIYEIIITKEKPKVEITLENEIIKKIITIKKKYGEENNLYNEQNITFQILNNNQDEIKEITTNEEGTATITLPYGKYTIIQDNTTPGYQKVEPIYIDVTNTEKEIIELKDLKIPVPNTHTEQNNYLELLFLILIILL